MGNVVHLESAFGPVENFSEWIVRTPDVSKVRRIVELVRGCVSESVSELDCLLLADPATGHLYRSSFRITVDEATEFDYRNAANIVNGRLSPASKVLVVFERGGSDGAASAVTVLPKAFSKPARP